MELKKSFGKNIKKYRRLQKLTQEQLAEKVGVEVISISFIETGRYFPSPANLVKLSEALNTSLTDLFDFKQEYTCDDYIYEINQKLKFLSNDKTKLSTIHNFIKSIMV